MTKPLPKSLSIEKLLHSALPGDTTLGEARAFLMKSDAIALLKGVSLYPDQVRIRVLDNDGAEVPDTMLMREVRRLIKSGSIHFAIDDGEGGVPVNA